MQRTGEITNQTIHNKKRTRFRPAAPFPAPLFTLPDPPDRPLHAPPFASPPQPSHRLSRAAVSPRFVTLYKERTLVPHPRSAPPCHTARRRRANCRTRRPAAIRRYRHGRLRHYDTAVSRSGSFSATTVAVDCQIHAKSVLARGLMK